jgi:hypothetical protein
MSTVYFKLFDKKIIVCDDPIEWMEWFIEAKGLGHRVALTEINELIWVSTIFTGIGSDLFDKPTPFETKVMGVEHAIITRAATWQEAEDNHEVAVLTARQLLARIDKSLGNWGKSNVPR